MKTRKEKTEDQILIENEISRRVSEMTIDEWWNQSSDGSFSTSIERDVKLDYLLKK